MYRIASIRSLVGIHLAALAIALINASLFIFVIGPRVPQDLEVYANTVVLTLGVIWLFFSTSIWLRGDEETKKTAEAIDNNDKKTFLTESSKRLSPAIWMLYFEITLLTLLGFDAFRVTAESSMFAGLINVLISYLIALTFLINYDGDDSLSGIIIVYNLNKIPSDWLKELNKILGK